MKADSIHLFDFLGSGKTIFEIPVYQRNYEWSKSECEQLFKDLIGSAQTSTSHFLGAVVYVTETGEKMSHVYRIIDGQQRLMSLTLLLKALADVDDVNKDEIEEEYLTNKYLEINNHLKLKPVEHDREAFFSVMEGMYGNKPSKVIENYQYFKKLIKDTDLSSQELFEAMNNFELVYVELSNDSQSENPQVIFESLNSTGVSLAPSDLVRNFLLMSLDTQSQDVLYEKYWIKIEKMFSTDALTEFIRHYLVTKTHTSVKKKNVYTGYKSYFISNQLNSEDALEDLYNFAIDYFNLLNASTSDDTFNKMLRHINSMDSRVVFPYLMMLMENIKSGKFSQEEVNKVTHILESYLIRLKVCKLPTNGLNKIVAGLCDLSKLDIGLESRLIKLIKNNFPSNKEVIKKLQEVDLYHLRNHIAKVTLISLEEEKSKETIDFDQAQIEHIMPQRLNDSWRLNVKNAEKIKKDYGGTLGNLTLTGYNQEMSNKTFDVKRQYYKESNVKLSREVAANYDYWGKDEILERSKNLAKQLIEIYPIPNIKEVVSQEIVGEYSVDESQDVTGKKPTSLVVNGDEYTVLSWSQMLVKFLNILWEYDSLNYDRIKENKKVKELLFKSSPRRGERLENGEVIETNFPASIIVAIISRISKICNINKPVLYYVK